MLYHENEQNDLTHVLAAVDGFVDGLGSESVYVQRSKIKTALWSMRQNFPVRDGLERASAFKKCANFLCFFMAEGPILKPFPKELVGDTLSKIRHHQNAMLGFYIAVEALHNATIFRKDKNVVLSNKIELSRHSYMDTIQALSLIRPKTHFHLVSVFLEQLCYKANPEASYEETI